MPNVDILFIANAWFKFDLKKEAGQNITNYNLFKKFMSQTISKELLEVLVCPLCKGKLTYDQEANELICHESKLAYQIKNGIPVMLINEARILDK